MRRWSKVTIEEQLRNNFSLNTVDDTGKTPLLWALEHKDKDLAIKLLDAGAEVNDCNIYCGTTALMYSARHGYVSITKRIIAGGVNVNQSNDDCETPLMWAAKTNRVVTVRILLEADADVHAQNSDGKTAAQLAEENMQRWGHLEVIDMLEQAAVGVKLAPVIKSKTLLEKEKARRKQHGSERRDRWALGG